MRSILIALLIVIACGGPADGTEPTGFVPNDVGADRIYTIQACRYDGQPSAQPCTMFRSSSTQDLLDSGRVVLKRDHSATWMIARRRLSYPCIASGNCRSDSTVTLSASIDTAAGAYVLGGTLILLIRSSRADTMRLTVELPARVDQGWPGPDSLRLHSDNSQPYVAVFKP